MSVTVSNRAGTAREVLLFRVASFNGKENRDLLLLLLVAVVPVSESDDDPGTGRGGISGTEIVMIMVLQ